MLYVFYITTTPYNNINQKELYDFYYTAITLTTGYKNIIIHYNYGCVLLYFSPASFADISSLE